MLYAQAGRIEHATRGGVRRSGRSRSAVVVFASGLLSLCCTPAALPTSEAASAPVLLSSVPTYGSAEAMDVAVGGNYAYVVTTQTTGLNPEFYIIDISFPKSPVVVGSLHLGANLNKVAVANHYAYLLAAETDKRATHLFIVDVADKVQPVVVGGYDTDVAARSVAAVGTRVYLGTANNPTDTGREFLVLDASNPSATTLLGSYEIGADVRDISVASGRAYLATSRLNQELCVLQVSTPSAITLVGSYPLPGNGGARGVVYTSGKVVSTSGKIHVVMDDNQTNPDYFVLNGIRIPPIGLLGSKDLQSDNTHVAVRGQKAFVSTTTATKGLTIVDVRNLTQPQVYSTYDSGAAAHSVALNGPHVYLATKRPTMELQILDANLPFRPEVRDVNGDGFITISCLGDSNTDQTGWSFPTWCAQLQSLVLPINVVTVNRGVSGSTAIPGLWTSADTELTDALMNDHPDVVIFAFGTNDLLIGGTGVPIPAIITAYQNVKARAEQAGAFVLIATTPPVYATGSFWDTFNAKVIQLNAQLYQTFPAGNIVDFYSDMSFPDDYYLAGAHMGVHGQAKRALRVYDQLIAK